MCAELARKAVEAEERDWKSREEERLVEQSAAAAQVVTIQWLSPIVPFIFVGPIEN